MTSIFLAVSSFSLKYSKTEYAEYVNLKKIADRAKEGMLRNLGLGDDGCSCLADHDRVDDRGVRGDHQQRRLCCKVSDYFRQQFFGVLEITLEASSLLPLVLTQIPADMVASRIWR